MDYISREDFSYSDCPLEFHTLFCGHGGLHQGDSLTNQHTGNEYGYMHLHMSTKQSEDWKREGKVQ